MTLSEREIETLSVEERLSLIERVWDSLSQTSTHIPLTDSQREELDRRIAELELEGPAAIPWEDLLDEINGRRVTTPSMSQATSFRNR